jgi:aminoglycoside phosphotransferase (APT) family kinase protein
MLPDRNDPGMGPPVVAWLGEVIRGQALAGTALLSGGYRNRNTLVATATGERFVLRQYLEPDGSHAGAIEAALLARLTGRVPVPEVVAADLDGAATGRPTLLCRFVPGVLLKTALAGSPGSASELGRGVGRTLAAIGALTFDGPGAFVDASLRTSDREMPRALPDFVARCLSSGPAASVLAADEQAAIVLLAEAAQAHVDAMPKVSQLVHSDFNAKNLLVREHAGSWTVAAVLDWEFAFSGSPLFDIGNMLRFPEDLPAGFAQAFVGGFAEGGGLLPDDWREISLALDLFALADLLTRSADHRYFSRALQAIRRQLAV